jgi:hypothetical protein
LGENPSDRLTTADEAAVFLFLGSLLCLYIVAIKPEQINWRGGLLLVALAFLYFASYLWRLREKN